MKKRFEKPFTQQEGLSQEAIERVREILSGGRLHRYNTLVGEMSEASLLEREYASWQGSKYCIAVTSGGQAMQIALRACGVVPGTKVLANAYTLAPVPGAMHAVGAKPVFVEIDENWHIDMADLYAKARESGAKYLLLSHMRGHVADMDAVVEICDEFGITLIEDCAHTMGAKWKGKRSGNFGKAACFSSQTYKHLNSGEGGFITSDDDELIARAIIGSGSYMLYETHGTVPPKQAFESARYFSPNCSARMDNIRAAILRSQLPVLEENVHRWNERYSVLRDGFSAISGITVPERRQHEEYVGSSFQFKLDALPAEKIPQLLADCQERGVDIKWFGANEPKAFTSRFDSWKYLGDLPDLPNTRKILAKTCDIRVPLTFSPSDCADIVDIVADEMHSRT